MPAGIEFWPCPFGRPLNEQTIPELREPLVQGIIGDITKHAIQGMFDCYLGLGLPPIEAYIKALEQALKAMGGKKSDI